MNSDKIEIKIILLVIAAILILIFSSINAAKLVVLFVGFTIIILGIFFDYRTASIIGLLIVIIGSSISIEFNSFSDLRQLQMAIIGLFIPLFLSTWVSLSSSDINMKYLLKVKKPIIITLFYVLITLISIPIFTLILSLTSPTISANISTLSEITIILFIAIGGILFIMMRNPRSTSQS